MKYESLNVFKSLSCIISKAQTDSTLQENNLRQLDLKLRYARKKVITMLVKRSCKIEALNCLICRMKACFWGFHRT